MYVCLVFIPTPAQSPSNPPNFLSDESDEGVICYVNEVTFGKAVKDEGWLPEEPTL